MSDGVIGITTSVLEPVRHRLANAATAFRFGRGTLRRRLRGRAGSFGPYGTELAEDADSDLVRFGN